MEQSFYCEECEYSEDIFVPSLGSHGFEIACPHCGTLWIFTAEKDE